MARPENQPGVEEILALLTPRILGKELPAWRCGCGACGCGPAVAIAVRPGGTDPRYAGQETSYYLWTVQMKSTDPAHAKNDYDYSIGLSSFVPTEELNEVFARVFPTEDNLRATANDKAKAARRASSEAVQTTD